MLTYGHRCGRPTGGHGDDPTDDEAGHDDLAARKARLSGLSLSAVLIEDETDLGALRERWDGLAVRTGNPYGAPAWALAWWHHVRPAGAVLRIVAVEEDGELIGLAPLYASSARGRAVYEVIAARLSPPAGILVEPGREAAVAEEIARTLAKAKPRLRLLRFWERPSQGELAPALAAGLSGRDAWHYVGSPTALPVIELEGTDYKGWLADRPSKFRQETSRYRRRIDDQGAVFGLAGDASQLEAGLDAFETLNAARWRERGGTSAVVPGLREMFREVAAELLGSERLRVYTISIEGQIVAVNILVAAGSEVAGWNSGFSEEWKRYSPSMLLSLYAVADSIGRGERRIETGPGEGGYKSRLAGVTEEIAQVSLIPRDAAYPLSRLRFAPGQLRSTVGRRLSERDKARVLQSVRRMTRRGSRRA